MSHYTTVRTQFRDLDALVKALEACGYRPEVHTTPQHLMGYMGDRRSQKAEIIVRRDQLFSAANDLGFQKQPDGTYSVHVFDYARDAQDQIIKRVTQQYGLIKATQALRRKGYRVDAPVTQQDGSIRLVAQRW